jgi:hypothetical protein
MEGAATMVNFSRDLIVRAGGQMRPGQTLGNYLHDLSAKTRIGVRSLWAGWRDEYMSAKTRETLENHIEKKARNNEDKAAANLELACRLDGLAHAAEVAGRSRREVGILRAAADSIRNGNPRTDTEMEEGT